MRMQKVLDKTPLIFVIAICLTLGLAPFAPEPHVWQKLKMLASGGLDQAIDIFDLLLHGAPWLLLALKLSMLKRRESGE